jgi:hypothetical protein
MQLRDALDWASYRLIGGIGVGSPPLTLPFMSFLLLLLEYTIVGSDALAPLRMALSSDQTRYHALSFGSANSLVLPMIERVITKEVSCVESSPIQNGLKPPCAASISASGRSKWLAS